MDYIKFMSTALDMYEEDVIPLLDQGNYPTAAAVIANSTFLFREGLMPFLRSNRRGNLHINGPGLLGRLLYLEKRCREEDQEGIDSGRELIGEKFDLVRLSLDSLLQKQK